MNDDTQECGHCCQDNPPAATLCSFCGQPLNGPDPIQEADIQDPTRKV